MEKADKKLGSWGMFGNKHEDAAELVEKACNQFKLGKSCEHSLMPSSPQDKSPFTSYNVPVATI